MMNWFIQYVLQNINASADFPVKFIKSNEMPQGYVLPDGHANELNAWIKNGWTTIPDGYSAIELNDIDNYENQLNFIDHLNEDDYGDRVARKKIFNESTNYYLSLCVETNSSDGPYMLGSSPYYCSLPVNYESVLEGKYTKENPLRVMPYSQEVPEVVESNSTNN